MKTSLTYEDKVILVTGGAGSIGQHIAGKLLHHGAKKVIVFDNLSSSVEWNVPDENRILFIKGSILNDQDTIRAFKEKPDFIFHAAAFFANQRSVNYPLADAETNILGILKLLELCSLFEHPPRFIYLNTEGSVYGNKNELPYCENNVSAELGSPYYISKRTAELYCNFYYQHYNIPITTLRLFNSYGPGEIPGEYRNVIPNFIFWAMKGLPLPITGNHDMTRDFVYVEDLANAILKSAITDETIGQCFNLCTGTETKIHDLAEKINFLTGNKAGIVIHKMRLWDKRIRVVGDNSMSKQLIGFNPCTSIDEGLQKTIDWFKNYWDLILFSANFKPGMSSAVENFSLHGTDLQHK